MPKFIPKDFTVEEHTIEFLEKKHQIPKAFLDQYVTDHFIEYWNELKREKKAAGKKSAWQTTYMTWAKRAWRGMLGREYENNRHNRDRVSGGGVQENVFDDTLAQLQGEKKQKKSTQPRRVHRPPPEPEPGEPMDALEALDEMKKILGAK